MNSCNTDRFLATTVVCGLSTLNCSFFFVARYAIPVARDAIPVARDAIPVARDAIPVARDAIRVARDGGNLHLSGTVVTLS